MEEKKIPQVIFDVSNSPPHQKAGITKKPKDYTSDEISIGILGNINKMAAKDKAKDFDVVDFSHETDNKVAKGLMKMKHVFE